MVIIIKSKKYDVVIIGAGIGGLVCGSILAKEGSTVLIIEKLSSLGGRLRSMEYNGYILDVANRAFIRRHVDEALERIGAECPLFKLGTLKVFNIPKNKFFDLTVDNAKECFSEGFNLNADETEDMVKMLIDAIQDPETWQGKTFQQWIDDCTENKRVRRFWTLFTSLSSGVSEFIDHDMNKVWMDTWMPFAIDILTQVEPIHYPASTEVGGSQALPLAFADAFEKYGGEIQVETEAKEVLIKDGKAYGLVLFDERSGSLERIECSRVIINAPIWDVFKSNLLDKKDFPSKLVKTAEKLLKAAGLFAVYWVGLKKKVIEHDGWVLILDEDLETGSHLKYVGELAPTSNFSPGMAPPGKQLIELIYCPSASEAKDLKAVIEKSEMALKNPRILFEKWGLPPFDDMIDFKKLVLFTPTWATWQFTPDWKDMHGVESPDVQNLFFVGDTVKMEPGEWGVDAAVASGMRCADIILHSKK